MGGQKVRTGPFHQRPPATALRGPCWRWLERTAPHNSPPGWSWSAQVSAWPIGHQAFGSYWELNQMDKEEKLGIDFKSFKLHLWRLHSDGREIRRSGRKRSPMRSSEYSFFSRSFYIELQVFARACWRQGTEEIEGEEKEWFLSFSWIEVAKLSWQIFHSWKCLRPKNLPQFPPQSSLSNAQWFLICC